MRAIAARPMSRVFDSRARDDVMAQSLSQSVAPPPRCPVRKDNNGNLSPLVPRIRLFGASK